MFRKDSDETWVDSNYILVYNIGQILPIHESDSYTRLYKNSLKDDEIMNQRDQIFRDNTNDNYCLFNPMLSWINNIKEQTNNFTTDLSAQKIKTYSSFYNNLLKLMKKYVNGIPESDLQLVSNKLNIKIEIKFPFECKYADNIISTTP